MATFEGTWAEFRALVATLGEEAMRSWHIIIREVRFITSATVTYEVAHLLSLERMVERFKRGFGCGPEVRWQETRTVQRNTGREVPREGSWWFSLRGSSRQRYRTGRT